MSIGKIILAVIITTTIYGCESSDHCDTWGIERNDFRRSDSLPILPESWSCSGKQLGEISWQDPNFAEKISNEEAFYGKKVVGYSEDSIIYERNYYYSGKLTTINPNGPDKFVTEEKLIIFRYYDHSYQETWGPWYSTIDSDNFFPVNRLSPKEVDSVLTQWGIKKLNY